MSIARLMIHVPSLMSASYHTTCVPLGLRHIVFKSHIARLQHTNHSIPISAHPTMFRPSKTIFGSLLLWLGPLTSLAASEIVPNHHLINVTQAVPLASSSRRFEVHWRLQSYRLNAWADYVVRLERREFAFLQ